MSLTEVIEILTLDGIFVHASRKGEVGWGGTFGHYAKTVGNSETRSSYKESGVDSGREA